MPCGRASALPWAEPSPSCVRRATLTDFDRPARAARPLCIIRPWPAAPCRRSASHSILRECLIVRSCRRCESGARPQVLLSGGPKRSPPLSMSFRGATLTGRWIGGAPGLAGPAPPALVHPRRIPCFRPGAGAAPAPAATATATAATAAGAGGGGAAAPAAASAPTTRAQTQDRPTDGTQPGSMPPNPPPPPPLIPGCEAAGARRSRLTPNPHPFRSEGGWVHTVVRGEPAWGGGDRRQPPPAHWPFHTCDPTVDPQTGSRQTAPVSNGRVCAGGGTGRAGLCAAPGVASSQLRPGPSLVAHGSTSSRYKTAGQEARYPRERRASARPRPSH